MTGIPSPTITWTRDGQKPMSVNTEMLQGGVVRMIDVILDNQGTYICRAENGVGPPVTGLIDLTVICKYNK